METSGWVESRGCVAEMLTAVVHSAVSAFLGRKDTGNSVGIERGNNKLLLPYPTSILRTSPFSLPFLHPPHSQIAAEFDCIMNVESSRENFEDNWMLWGNAVMEYVLAMKNVPAALKNGLRVVAKGPGM